MHIREDGAVCVHLGGALSCRGVQPCCSSLVYHVQSPSRLRMSALWKSLPARTNKPGPINVNPHSLHQSMSFPLLQSGSNRKALFLGVLQVKSSGGPESKTLTSHSAYVQQKMESSPTCFCPVQKHGERRCSDTFLAQPPVHLVLHALLPTHTLTRQ